jgi:hypothetical protein
MIMITNLGVMAYLRIKVDKQLVQGNTLGAKNALTMIGKYMVPLNIVLGIVAIYLGVTLRNA